MGRKKPGGGGVGKQNRRGKGGLMPRTLKVWHELTTQSDQGPGGAKTGDRALVGTGW